MTLSAAVIIPAAGMGTRMKLDHPKQYHQLAGMPILVHSVKAFLNNHHFKRIIVAVPKDWIEQTTTLFHQHLGHQPKISVIAGGIRRQDSVRNCLNCLDKSCDIVLVHDGARPLISQEVIHRCYDAIAEDGAAIAAIPVKDTLKKDNGKSMVASTIDRASLWQAQTPQGARRVLLEKAYKDLGNRDVTDESSLLELAGIPVTIVEGSETNFKITRPEDLLLAEKIMAKPHTSPMRIGHGFDAHQLVENRKLVLGGITIPHSLGLAGHSDADVLTHALCDALLGALGEGDIGRHFPDSDEKFSNIYSINLLEQVISLSNKRSYFLVNADITLVCQAPRLAPFIEQMREVIAKACEVDTSHINIKATTTEKMGFAGRSEGISCHAVALLHSRN